MLINPDNRAPRLSWNRPGFDRRFYPDQGETLFVFSTAESQPTAESVLYQQAQKIIDRQYSDPEFSIEQLAAEIGFSPRQLQRIFKSQGSLGFRAELRQKRLDHACQELRNSTKSLQQISDECGYRRSGHFSRVFSKELGQTPKQYRRKVVAQP